MGGVTIKEYGLSFVWVCLKNYIGRSWPVLAIFLAGIIISIIVSVLGKKNLTLSARSWKESGKHRHSSELFIGPNPGSASQPVIMKSFLGH